MVCLGGSPLRGVKPHCPGDARGGGERRGSSRRGGEGGAGQLLSKNFCCAGSCQGLNEKTVRPREGEKPRRSGTKRERIGLERWWGGEGVRANDDERFREGSRDSPHAAVAPGTTDYEVKTKRRGKCETSGEAQRKQKTRELRHTRKSSQRGFG